LSQINWTDELTSHLFKLFLNIIFRLGWGLQSDVFRSHFPTQLHLTTIFHNRPAFSDRNIVPDFTDSKGNVVLVHVIQVYRRSKDTAPLILNLGHKWRRNLTARPG
jgi:hypothetical protein